MSLAGQAAAEEGMWTFDAFPAARVRSDLGWAPSKAWLDKARTSAVRLTEGCSGSFVSAQGLILTNDHCTLDCLQSLSTAGDDLAAKGFNARQLADERKCPGQQAEVVTAISDVTRDVRRVIGSLSGEALVKARDRRIAEIEQAGCPDTARTRCEVVALYNGGQYKLYAYRKYSDIRLVWAPEFQAAFFGGDPDNFNFPRYALDSAFLRAYENGRPASPPDHLRWNPRAPEEGEATFVVGNPGSTDRLYTEAQRAFLREEQLPLALSLYAEYRGRLISLMNESAEKQREGRETLLFIENILKAYSGQLQALNDDVFSNTLKEHESELRKNSINSEIGAGNPWEDISRASDNYRNFYFSDYFLNARAGWGSMLFSYARTLTRAAEERAKPNAERLPEYTDSALSLTQKQLLDPRPVYLWLEELKLAFWLSKAREHLGADDPDVKLLLGRESPETMAARLVTGSKLAQPAYRKLLWEGGLAGSDDPLIQLAVRIDARSRALQERYGADYDAPVTAAAAKIAAMRFASFGDTVYPDANFTLRISYGTVKAWTERGSAVPILTRMGGIFERATGQQPFLLANAFEANKVKIDPHAPFDFVTTNDIIGGSSGSPVLDKAGSVIGALFDGNIHSLGGDFGYDGTSNRAVAVSTAAVQEALKQIYPAPRLLRELGSAGKEGP